ncbi:MAG: low molecular weight phosphatase family protein [Rhodocyclaceae bacterium]|nr:low molecular weight phosphatase family protein [Rhodocyclaceae bacterium]
MRYLLGQFEAVVGPAHRFRALDAPAVSRLVFVCLGNINRSAFGHAVALRDGLASTSIGLATTTGAPATPAARKVAREMGYSLDEHQATAISDFQRASGDLLLVMELRHAHRLLARGVPADAIALLGHWARPMRYHIHDPDTLSIEYFRSCFATIQAAVQGLATELKAANSPSAEP